MEIIKNRLYLTGSELEYIARCPRSIRHLAEINQAITCKRCQIFQEILKFIFQKNFKNSKPTIKIIEKQFVKIAKKIKYKTDLTTRDRIILNDLLIWGNGAADKVNNISIKAEIHFGLITINDYIDAVIDDFDGNFSLLKIICDEAHTEHLFNYKTLFKSLWMRNEYKLNTNNLLILKPTEEGIKIERANLAISTPVIKNTINHILLPISHILFSRNTDNPNDFNSLSPIFGDYCWKCMGCFLGDKKYDENQK